MQHINIAVDDVNAAGCENKVDLGDASNGGGSSNDDGGAEDVDGFNINCCHDANCGNGSSKVDCSDN